MVKATWLYSHELPVVALFSFWFPDPRQLRGSLRISLMCLSVMGLVFTRNCHSYLNSNCSHVIKSVQTYENFLNILFYLLFGLLLLNAIACPQFYGIALCLLHYFVIMIISALITYLVMRVVLHPSIIPCYENGAPFFRLISTVGAMTLALTVYHYYFFKAFADMLSLEGFVKAQLKKFQVGGKRVVFLFSKI
ncbi:hypothetical protein CDAR_569881 [Caerostris darwini]|uniref:Uncharacterized protein n=1 Tax=Caerostris darwini TaxID=1538125 RepID=A0AAV4RYD0_9ARAC|nr:hypothetical protein CDAR_569881 [Caerostris darwini]